MRAYSRRTSLPFSKRSKPWRRRARPLYRTHIQARSRSSPADGPTWMRPFPPAVPRSRRRAGYRYLFDRKYLWVADRDNPAYGRPDIFVCFIPPTYWSVAIRLVGVNRYTRCSENRVIELAERPYKAVWPRHTLVARDPSGRDTWAIVRLDWDFPPYLGAKPRVEGVAAGESVSLTVRYDYRQQDGKPERQTETEIRPISRNGATCTLRGAPLAAAKAVGGKAAFTLTPSDFGKDLVALVRPQSETRTGAPFFSAPFRVDQGTVVAMTPACGTIVDMEKKVWPQTGGG